MDASAKKLDASKEAAKAATKKLDSCGKKLDASKAAATEAAALTERLQGEVQLCRKVIAADSKKYDSMVTENTIAYDRMVHSLEGQVALLEKQAAELREAAAEEAMHGGVYGRCLREAAAEEAMHGGSKHRVEPSSPPAMHGGSKHKVEPSSRGKGKQRRQLIADFLSDNEAEAEGAEADSEAEEEPTEVTLGAEYVSQQVPRSPFADGEGVDEVATEKGSESDEEDSDDECFEVSPPTRGAASSSEGASSGSGSGSGRGRGIGSGKGTFSTKGSGRGRSSSKKGGKAQVQRRLSARERAEATPWTPPPGYVNEWTKEEWAAWDMPANPKCRPKWCGKWCDTRLAQLIPCWAWGAVWAASLPKEGNVPVGVRMEPSLPWRRWMAAPGNSNEFCPGCGKPVQSGDYTDCGNPVGYTWDHLNGNSNDGHYTNFGWLCNMCHPIKTAIENQWRKYNAQLVAHRWVIYAKKDGNGKPTGRLNQTLLDAHIREWKAKKGLMGCGMTQRSQPSQPSQESQEY